MVKSSGSSRMDKTGHRTTAGMTAPAWGLGQKKNKKFFYKGRRISVHQQPNCQGGDY